MKGISTNKALMYKYETLNVGDITIFIIFIKNLAYRQQYVKGFIYTNPIYFHNLRN